MELWFFDHELKAMFFLPAPRNLFFTTCTLPTVLFCTAMLSHVEILRYSITCRGLRVTQSFGEQNSFYELQPPYLYTVSLILVSELPCWLVSEISALIRINVYLPGET